MSIILISSAQVFPDEESCEDYLKAYREKVGIRCETWKSNTKHYGLAVESFLSAALAGVGAP